MIWLLFLIVFVVALYRSFKFKNRKWFFVLLIILGIGALDLAANIYMSTQTNCGALYDRDLGCMNALPGWSVTLGLVALAASLLLSLAVIVMSFTKGPRHN